MYTIVLSPGESLSLQLVNGSVRHFLGSCPLLTFPVWHPCYLQQSSLTHPLWPKPEASAFQLTSKGESWFLFLCPLNQMIPTPPQTPLANESLPRATAAGEIDLWFMFINIMNITVKFFTLALSFSSNKKLMTSTKNSSVTATGKPFSENVVTLPQLGAEVNGCSSLDL